MKTIIVPTDLRPGTEVALSVAADIARVYKASIVLLHSVVYPVQSIAYAGSMPVTTDSMVRDFYDAESEAEKEMRRLISQKKYQGIDIKLKLITNGDGMVADVTGQKADLIVMTSQGASGLEELFFGSNAEVIVRHAHCPVLIVKEAIEHFRPENIVCAIDTDDRLKTIHHYPFQMGEQGLHKFLYVFTPTDGKVVDGVREWMSDFARTKGITDYELALRTANTVQEGIIDYAEETKADLIVLFTHGYKGLRHLLSGSVAEDVLNHAKTPVLVMRV
ncbi:universal stress protein [Salmonirosea aquatica]|uniref:Universal stress protein n=1 Tax=Salmonirosea aquatica TaxID=2654236 RepID=A0A7C9BCZ6_9BACT|nr:universal stress protein [Cytophagaceae bacterium SJW1-29]